MRQQGWPEASAEPVFEVPPQVAVPERRLTGRAGSDWHGGLPHEFRDNAVTLALMPRSDVRVTAVGTAVAATFKLRPGALAGNADSLAAVLTTACAGLASEVLPFEATVKTVATCAILRGVLLPTSTGAEAVLSWKEVLSGDAALRLRAELLAALRPSRPARDPFAR